MMMMMVVVVVVGACSGDSNSHGEEHEALPCDQAGWCFHSTSRDDDGDGGEVQLSVQGFDDVFQRETSMF